MTENIINSYLSRPVRFISSTVSYHKQTLILGLSSSLNGGAAYGYIVSRDYHYFTPALGIIAGLIGGLGIAAREIFAGKEKHNEDIPLKDIAAAILFGIIAIFLGYVLVYYFVKLPGQGLHGAIFSLPAEQGTITEFLRATMKMEDVTATILGSISSLALPMLFGEKIRALMKKLKINQFYPASK